MLENLKWLQPFHVAPPRRSRPASPGPDGGTEVVGELDPYLDPDCGCTVQTTFRGAVRVDVVSGTFESAAPDSEHYAEGTWRAARQRSPGN